MFDKLTAIEKRYEDILQQLGSAELQSDPSEYRKQAKALSEIEPIVERFREYKTVVHDLAQTEELAASGDADMRELAQEEIKSLVARRDALLAELKILLIPKDPNDEKNVVLEIRAGTGGDEAALFAAELFRMYTKYAERQGWRMDVMSTNDTGVGGIKEVIATIEGRGAYSRLKYESGVHRVQRVPATEAAGRVHTSTVTVAVLPEAEEVDIQINDKDLRVDTFCSSGPGGQSVNTTYSAVRITHIPTGLVVSQQDEKSQIKNRAKAMKILRSRLYEMELQRQQEAIVAVAGRNVFERLKFESGVHRVQRVPETEASGRIHTSAATVAVLPEAEEVDVQIDEKDLRIDVFRSSGPGGQSVNTTDSAVRITHLPTGIVVSQQDEKSQHKNKARAMKVLRARLYERERQAADAARALSRKTQVGTGDRSERIRTYNFPQGRVTDHRINLTLYKLDKVMSGEALDEIIDALIAEDQAARLAEVE